MSGKRGRPTLYGTGDDFDALRDWSSSYKGKLAALGRKRGDPERIEAAKERVRFELDKLLTFAENRNARGVAKLYRRWRAGEFQWHGTKKPLGTPKTARYHDLLTVYKQKDFDFQCVSKNSTDNMG